MSAEDVWGTVYYRERFEKPELERLREQNERLRKFAEFVLKWCDRGPPHAGPGQEAVALDAIRNHPVLSAMRREPK